MNIMKVLVRGFNSRRTENRFATANFIWSQSAYFMLFIKEKSM